MGMLDESHVCWSSGLKAPPLGDLSSRTGYNPMIVVVCFLGFLCKRCNFPNHWRIIVVPNEGSRSTSSTE